MMTLFLLLILLGVAAGVWFQGLWNAALTLINLILAMLIATNFWEPVCTLVESFGGGSLTYLLDFLILWVLFAAAFASLRGITDMLSATRIKFDLPVEMAGRSVLALWCGWLFMSFTAVTMQTAPLGSVNPLGAWSTPSAGCFMGMAPDRMWLGFVQMTSRGALARGNRIDTPDHPNDQALNVETFDPHSEFPIKYHDRRAKFSDPSVGISIPR